MLLKDRYSVAFIFLFVGLILSLALFRLNNKLPAALCLIMPTSYLAFLYFQKARLHLKEHQYNPIGIEPPVAKYIKMKPETGCQFMGIENIDKNGTITGIDGIRIDWGENRGNRYKIVNGADVYLSDQQLFIPMGFGSALMQKIGNGGYEPKSIQNDKCWN
ncbi:MAG TPA: hypothetical protein PK239_14705 [Chitinophagales bacterium]|nr:hypothetical protein [Chitinophagales bacterium]HRK28524.1 hypothetical protein [Chitinophagales bacterium]